MSDKPMTHREAMQEDIGEATARLIKTDHRTPSTTPDPTTATEQGA